MKIAAYNIWNSEASNRVRFGQIADEIVRVDADVFALQEVADRRCHDALAERCGYRYSVFFPHYGEDEGLSLLSRFPITDGRYISSAVMGVVRFEGVSLSVTNVHLDWKSALKREREIVAIEKAAALCDAELAVMLGDFNCTAESSVQGYLLGRTSLNGRDADPFWYDLAESHADMTASPPEITLDFRNNPRWRGEYTLEPNRRYDRILLRSPYPRPFPRLTDFGVFGKDVSPETGYAPSDHYGVCCTLCV